MTIENLGVKLYSGTKADRKSDSLGSAADGTNSGITKIGKIGAGQASFDGNDKASVTGQTIALSNDGWAVSGWFYSTTAGSLQMITYLPTSGSDIYLYKNTDNTIKTEGLGGTISSSAISTNQWYHFVINYDHSSTTTTLYLDGTSAGTATGAQAVNITSIEIGAEGSSYYWNGKMDDVAVFSRKLTSAEITSLSGGDATSTISATNLQALYTFDSNFNDSSTNSRNLTNSGVTLETAKLGTGAYSFDGTDDYVKISNDLDAMVSGDFSVAGWVYFNNADTGTTHETILRKGSGSSYSDPYHDFFLYQYNTGVNLTVNDGSTYQSITGTAGTTSVGWHHVCVTRASNVYTLYVDGISNGTMTHTTTFGTQPWYFGCSENGTGTFERELDGKLDDWGCWARVLTATEISDLVNAQNASIGSDGNFTSNSNLTYGETGIVGNAIKGNGSSSYAENGTNTTNFKYINGVDETWTINFWFKKTTAETNNTACIMGTCGGGSVVGFRINYLDRTDESETRQLQLNIRSGNGAMYTINNDSFFPNDTNWHMMTITGDNSVTSNSVYVYLDNTQKVTANRSVAGSDTSTQHELNLFREPDGSPYWDGTLDEMSFWNRVLTSDERTALYNSGSGAVTTTAVTNHSGLKAYYDMNESSGTIENKVTYSADGALISSLTDKSNLKAYYSMDSTSMGAVANYTTNFSSNTGWTESSGNVTIDTSDEEMDFHIESGTSGAKGYYDLTTVSDTNWVLRFENWNLSTLNTYGGMWMGISSQTSADGANSGSSIFTRLADYGDGDDYLVVASFNSSTTRVDGSVGRPALSTGTNYNIELSRDGTTVTTKLFTDNFKTPIATSTDTISGTTGLRYLFVGSEYQPASGNTNTNMIGTMQGIKFYNGVSAVDGCKNDFSSTSDLDSLSGVRTNSIFQQTDDTPTYWWYNGTSWLLDGTTDLYSSDFANNSTGWSTSNSRGGFDSTGAWAYNETSTPSNSAKVNYDLGVNVGTKFILRWRMKVDSGTQPNNYGYFWLSTEDSLTPSNYTGFVWKAPDAKVAAGKNIGDPSTTFSISSNTWYYFEITRSSIGSGGGVLKSYSDSTYSGTGTTIMTFDTTGGGSERYLQLKATHNGNNSTKHYVDAIQLQNGTSEWLE